MKCERRKRPPIIPKLFSLFTFGNMSKARSALMSQTNINNASNTVIQIFHGQPQPFNDNESATKDIINVRWGCKLSTKKCPCELKLKKEYSKAVSCTYCNRNNIFEYYYCDKDKCIMCLICGGEEPVTPPHTPICGTNGHSKRQKSRKRMLSILGNEPENKRMKFGMGGEVFDELKVEDFDELNDYTDDMMNCLNNMKEYNYNLKKRFMEYRENKQIVIAKWKQKYVKASNDVTDRDGQIRKLKRELAVKDNNINENNKEYMDLEEELKRLRRQLFDEKKKVKEKDAKIKKLQEQIDFWEDYRKGITRWTKLGEKLQLFNSND
eukprot:508484_1